MQILIKITLSLIKANKKIYLSLFHKLLNLSLKNIQEYLIFNK